MAHARSADIADTIGQRMQPCMVCHGPEGRATTQGFFPRIAGKPAAYLYHQLIAFREGRRSNSTMAYFVDHMTDAYLQEIADYFAGLDLPHPPPRPAQATPTQLARGETLVRHGDRALGVPACAACHGVTLTGALPAIPSVLGLPREYLHVAVRLVAGRCAPRARARLHGPDRVAPGAAGPERRGRLAGVATGAGQCCAGRADHASIAAAVRQRPSLR